MDLLLLVGGYPEGFLKGSPKALVLSADLAACWMSRR